MANIFEPEWQFERDEPALLRASRVGAQAGAPPDQARDDDLLLAFRRDDAVDPLEGESSR